MIVVGQFCIPSMHQVGAIAKLGATVLATFGAVWAPWLTSSDAVLGVLQRLFPTQRGLYEDYVANFWCVSSRVIKWTRFLSQGQLVQLCSLATLMAAAPAMVMQVRRPSPRGLLLCMTNCALSFFLFSYQVSSCMTAGRVNQQAHFRLLRSLCRSITGAHLAAGS